MADVTSESTLEEALTNLLLDVQDAQDTPEDDRDEAQVILACADIPAIKSVRSFDESMVLTRNAGIVLRLEDGSEYQITIVQSRSAKE